MLSLFSQERNESITVETYVKRRPIVLLKTIRLYRPWEPVREEVEPQVLFTNTGTGSPSLLEKFDVKEKREGLGDWDTRKDVKRRSTELGRENCCHPTGPT